MLRPTFKAELLQMESSLPVLGGSGSGMAKTFRATRRRRTSGSPRSTENGSECPKHILKVGLNNDGQTFAAKGFLHLGRQLQMCFLEGSDSELDHYVHHLCHQLS